MPRRPGGLDKLGREPLDPPVYGDVVNGDATLGQQFLDVAVGQPVAQVPADCDWDHLPREPEPREHRWWARRRHCTSLCALGWLVQQESTATGLDSGGLVQTSWDGDLQLSTAVDVLPLDSMQEVRGSSPRISIGQDSNSKP